MKQNINKRLKRLILLINIKFYIFNIVYCFITYLQLVCNKHKLFLNTNKSLLTESHNYLSLEMEVMPPNKAIMPHHIDFSSNCDIMTSTN